MHFEPSQFVNFTKKKLKADAVPTIFNVPSENNCLPSSGELNVLTANSYAFLIAYECQSVKRITSCKHYQCSNNLKSKVTVVAKSFKLAELLKANTTLFNHFRAEFRIILSSFGQVRD